MEEFNQQNQSHQSYQSVNAECCCFNLRKITRSVTQYFDRHLDPSGIRATQFTLLIALSSTNAKTLTEIAEGLVMDRTTLTRNLKPLEKLGFISTVQTVDKRSKAYILTEKGREVLAKAVPLWREAQQHVVSNFGDERYQNILTELSTMLNITTPKKGSKKR